MLVALPASHRLAARSSVGLGELAQEPFVLYPRGNGQALYDAVIAACQASGFSPRIVQEAPQMVSTISLVAAGIGIAVVPESMRQLHGNGVAYLPIQGAVPVASMHVVHAAKPVPTVVLNFRVVLRGTLEGLLGGEAERPRPNLSPQGGGA